MTVANGTKILILGYGEMGHAMESLLHDRHVLTIWNHRPRPDLPKVELEQAVSENEVILFCLPIIPHEEICRRIAPYLPAESLCLSIAKGIDERGRCAAQIFADVFPTQQSYGLIYGPMISEELRAGRFGFAEVAGQSEAGDVFTRVHALFSGSQLYLAPTQDLLGISWAVILKNVYAILFGMADELALGDNVRGFLAAESLRELGRIVAVMGGQAESVYHFAGLGDLITTATSEDSHHHTLGRQLARGDRQDVRGEGVHTLQMILEHKVFETVPYALFNVVVAILFQQRDPEQSIRDYLSARFA